MYFSPLYAYTTPMVAEGVHSLEVEVFILGPGKQFSTHLTQSMQITLTSTM